MGAGMGAGMAGTVAAGATVEDALSWRLGCSRAQFTDEVAEYAQAILPGVNCKIYFCMSTGAEPA